MTEDTNTVTGQCDMILVPRKPTAEMLEAAWADALAEDAAGVWEAMIQAYAESNGKAGAVSG